MGIGRNEITCDPSDGKLEPNNCRRKRGHANCEIEFFSPFGRLCLCLLAFSPSGVVCEEGGRRGPPFLRPRVLSKRKESCQEEKDQTAFETKLTFDYVFFFFVLREVFGV